MSRPLPMLAATLGLALLWLPPSAVSDRANAETACCTGRFALSPAPRQGALIRGRVPAGTTRLTLDGAPVAIAADGQFILGFGRDFGPAATLSAYGPDGQAVTETLSVAPTRWRVEALSTVRRIPVPSAEFEARRAGELAVIAAARKTRPGAEGWRQAFAWPARGRISGVFGSQRIYAGEPGAPHYGVDVAAPAGAPVTAPADGVVILAAPAPFTLEGLLVLVDHGMGLESAFLHLSRIDVRTGDRVRQGQTIGAVGATGRASGPHLHWGLRWNDVRIDPQQVAGPMR